MNQRNQPDLHALHYNLGYVWYQQLALQQAAESYCKAIVLSRRSPPSSQQLADVHQNLGVVLAKQERWLAAIYYYRRAIALQPENIAAYCNLGTALLEQKDPEAAIQIYQQAIALQSRGVVVEPSLEATLYHHLGQALQKQQRLGEAIAAYSQSIALEDTKAQVHYNLGRAFRQQKAYQQAISCFERSLQLDPHLLVAAGECGFALLALGQVDQAMRYWQQAIAPDADVVEAIESEAIGSNTPGDELTRASIAGAAWLKALQMGTADADEALVQVLVHWGNALTEYGGNSQLRYAEMLYQRALQLRPQRIDLHLQLANCLRQQQRFAAAVMVYHLAQAIAPQNPQVYLELGHLLQQQQQWQSALHYYRQAVVLQGGRTAWRSQISQRAAASQVEAQLSPDMPEASERGKNCAGLNCEACLSRITQWFEPVCLEPGIYRLPRRSNTLPAETVPTLPVTTLVNGRVWVAPQENSWKVCRAIATFTADGELIPALSRSYPGQLPGCQHCELPLEGVPDLQGVTPECVNGTVVVLAGLSGSVYFHWMTDVLPRIEILQQQGIDLNCVDYFLVNSYQRSFQQETLTAFGITKDRIIESDRHPYIQAKRLIVPSFPGPLGWMQPWAIDALRSIFLLKLLPKLYPDSLQNRPVSRFFRRKKKLAVPLREFSDADLLKDSSCIYTCIYISRADARYRKVLNEAAVLEVLRPLGFVSVQLDDLSVVEQAKLFSNARVIVAPHGSGLTNLIFCQPGAKVIELVSPDYVRHYFWSISQHLDLEHYVVWGRDFFSRSLRQLIYPNPLIEDIWVDLDRLHRVMQAIGLTSHTAS